MPVHTNSIDGLLFLSMEGEVYRRQQQVEIIERAGVDGSGVRWTGRRGKPFELVTINYVESFDTAKENMDLYAALVGSGPVELIRYSVDEGTFVILGAVERSCFAIFNSLGGIQLDPENPVDLQVCQVVSWVLLG